MKEINQAIEKDLFGHESWIVVGNEQHKRFWYALIGDCSSWNTIGNGITKNGKYIIPSLNGKQEFEPNFILVAETFPKLIKKINQIIIKIEESSKRNKV